MIFVNFKTYPQGSGLRSIELADLLKRVASGSEVNVIPVVQTADIREVKEKTGTDVWVQHIDPVEYGAHTGAVLAEAVKEDGAAGTFLNHSEKKFSDFNQLSIAHKRAKDAGLKSLVFAADLEELERIIVLKPDFVAYEPPELVGSTTETVATAHPDVIKKAADISIKVGIPLIVGAGVHSKEDVVISIKLGAVGIAVATDIVKAEDPEKNLKQLMEGFNKS